MEAERERNLQTSYTAAGALRSVPQHNPSEKAFPNVRLYNSAIRTTHPSEPHFGC